MRLYLFFGNKSGVNTIMSLSFIILMVKIKLNINNPDQILKLMTF